MRGTRQSTSRLLLVGVVVLVLVAVVGYASTRASPPTSPSITRTSASATTTSFLSATTASATATTSPSSLSTMGLQSQTIQYTMPVGSFLGVNVSYARTLRGGDVVNGSVQLTGKAQSRDYSYYWRFQVLGPDGESVYDWTGNWMSNNYHSFQFTASNTGTYRIVVTHHSLYQKYLTIQITPPGWR